MIEVLAFPEASPAALEALREAFPEAAPAALEAIARRLADPAPWIDAPTLPHAAQREENHAQQRWQVLRALEPLVPRLGPDDAIRLFALALPLRTWRDDDIVRWRFDAVEDLVRAAAPSAGGATAPGPPAGTAGDLERVARAFARAGLDPDDVGRLALHPRHVARPFSLQRWPSGGYYAARPHLVAEALTDGLRQTTGSWRTTLLEELDRVLADVGDPPASLLPTLVEVAFGTAKGARELVLVHLPDGPEAVAIVRAAARSRRSGVRRLAADWLAARGLSV